MSLPIPFQHVFHPCFIPSIFHLFCSLQTILLASKSFPTVAQPSGEILDVEIVDGGLICSSGVALEALGDVNDDCYVVNAAVYVGY